MADQLTIDLGPRDRVTALAYEAAAPRAGVTFVLGHGAGAGQSSRFIVRFAAGLASRGVDVLTFNFLYTEQRRRLPDRTEKLETCYRAALQAARTYDPFAGNVLCIGGKSMGGRIATHLAAMPGDVAAAGIKGVILLGYPLHPPGKPDQLRAAHLANIHVPMLFVQGARDPFGTPEELQTALQSLAAPVTLHVVENGDHSLAPPKSSRVPVDHVYDQVLDIMVRWMAKLPASGGH